MIGAALALALVAHTGLAAMEPRLGVVDATPTGAPEITAAVTAEAQKLGKLDVQPADVIDAAVAEARKVGAACAFDAPPECWARFGVISELDRIVVLRVVSATLPPVDEGGAPVPDIGLDLLYVDVPTRTASRSSTQLPAELEKRAPASAAALSALLTGKPSPNPRRTHATSSEGSAPPAAAAAGHGALWAGGITTAAVGGIALVGCGAGALVVSSQLAGKLVAARDGGVPLDDGYRALDTSFVALGICAGAAAAVGVGGAVVAGVAE